MTRNQEEQSPTGARAAENETPTAERTIGLDLVGIGDFFGGIVVAAVAITAEEANELEALGLRAPPKWTPEVVRRGLRIINAVVGRPHIAWIGIGAERYNELLSKMGGRAAVIGWAHSQCVEKLQRRGAARAVAIASDFGDREFVRQRLARRHLDVEVRQVAHAESEPGVLAASYFAHLRWFQARRKMARRYHRWIPAGARDVEGFARGLMAAHGEEVLGEVAKRDFRTFDDLLQKNRGA